MVGVHRRQPTCLQPVSLATRRWVPASNVAGDTTYGTTAGYRLISDDSRRSRTVDAERVTRPSPRRVLAATRTG